MTTQHQTPQSLNQPSHITSGVPADGPQVTGAPLNQDPATMAPWTLLHRLEQIMYGGTGVLSPSELNQCSKYLESLSRIHAELDGSEWSSKTSCAIAEILVDAGLEVSDSVEDEDLYREVEC